MLFFSLCCGDIPRYCWLTLGALRRLALYDCSFVLAFLAILRSLPGNDQAFQVRCEICMWIQNSSSQTLVTIYLGFRIYYVFTVISVRSYNPNPSMMTMNQSSQVSDFKSHFFPARNGLISNSNYAHLFMILWLFSQASLRCWIESLDNR